MIWPKDTGIERAIPVIPVTFKAHNKVKIKRRPNCFPLGIRAEALFEGATTNIMPTKRRLP